MRLTVRRLDLSALPHGRPTLEGSCSSSAGLGLFYADGVCSAAQLAKFFILFRSDPAKKNAPKPAQVPPLVTVFLCFRHSPSHRPVTGGNVKEEGNAGFFFGKKLPKRSKVPVLAAESGRF